MGKPGSSRTLTVTDLFVASPEGAKGSTRTLIFEGMIDEHSDFAAIHAGDEENLILDLAKVNVINSLGIRSWVLWLKSFRNRNVIFARCSKAVVDQINVIEGLLPSNASVESFFVPYRCEGCGRDDMVLYRRGSDFQAGTADSPERVTGPVDVSCSSCRATMEKDVLDSKYFRFLKYRRSPRA